MAKVIVVQKDAYGHVVDVREERVCGPVCQTVKVVGTLTVAALLIGALSQKS